MENLQRCAVATVRARLLGTQILRGPADECTALDSVYKANNVCACSSKDEENSMDDEGLGEASSLNLSLETTSLISLSWLILAKHYILPLAKTQPRAVSSILNILFKCVNSMYDLKNVQNLCIKPIFYKMLCLLGNYYSMHDVSIAVVAT